MIGERVRALQQMLKDLGYFPGVLSGQFDAPTQQAVKRFQRDNQLAVDGHGWAPYLDAALARWGGYPGVDHIKSQHAAVNGRACSIHQPWLVAASICLTARRRKDHEYY